MSSSLRLPVLLWWAVSFRFSSSGKSLTDSIGGRKGRDPINVRGLPTGCDWNGQWACEFPIQLHLRLTYEGGIYLRTMLIPASIIYQLSHCPELWATYSNRNFRQRHLRFILPSKSPPLDRISTPLSPDLAEGKSKTLGVIEGRRWKKTRTKTDNQLNLRNDALRRKFDSLKYDLKRCEDVVYDLTLRGLVKAPAS